MSLKSDRLEIGLSISFFFKIFIFDLYFKSLFPSVNKDLGTLYF